MEYFINMSIEELLKLQQEIKKINNYEGNLKNRDELYLFTENISFFSEISNDIDEKLDDVYNDEYKE